MGLTKAIRGRRFAAGQIPAHEETKKLPRSQHPQGAQAQETLHRFDARENADGRRAESDFGRRELEHDEIHPPIFRGEIEGTGQAAGADFEPVQQGIDRQPLGAVVDRGEAMAESGAQPTQPPNAASAAEDDERAAIQGRYGLRFNHAEQAQSREEPNPRPQRVAHVPCETGWRQSCDDALVAPWCRQPIERLVPKTSGALLGGMARIRRREAPAEGEECADMCRVEPADPCQSFDGDQKIVGLAGTREFGLPGAETRPLRSRDEALHAPEPSFRRRAERGGGAVGAGIVGEFSALHGFGARQCSRTYRDHILFL